MDIKIYKLTKLIMHPKQAIPKKIKQLVWNKHIGESIGKAKCKCCNLTEIYQMDFSCGHIISDFNGGQATINNLLPICSLCNTSMGTMNMNEFISKHELYAGNKNVKLDISAEQILYNTITKIIQSMNSIYNNLNYAQKYEKIYSVISEIYNAIPKDIENIMYANIDKTRVDANNDKIGLLVVYILDKIIMNEKYDEFMSETVVKTISESDYISIIDLFNQFKAWHVDYYDYVPDKEKFIDYFKLNSINYKIYKGRIYGIRFITNDDLDELD